MFTGIITAVGKIVAHHPHAKGFRLTIDVAELDMSDVVVGDSIAVNGCCLTATAVRAAQFDADVSQETIDCTSGLDGLVEVNLEKSLRLADRLGGHLVSGHVDGVGEVVKFEPVGESQLLRIRAPGDLARYIARKGSICIQGVSLTTNRVEGVDFEINLIPHTISVTTLRNLRVGARVNLEVDMVARYIERLTQSES